MAVWYNKSHLILIVAPNSLYLNSYNDINQGPGEYSSETIDTQGAIG